MTAVVDKVFQVASPAPELVGTVTLARTTWQAIVEFKHADVATKLPEIMSTAESPSEIVESSSRPGHLIFVNREVVSPKGGDPLTVVVKPVGGEGLVSIVHFKRRKSNAKVLWTRSE